MKNQNLKVSSGKNIICNSVDFHGKWCTLSEESAVPLGNGKLESNKNSKYFEKICVSESSVRFALKYFDFCISCGF